MTSWQKDSLDTFASPPRGSRNPQSNFQWNLVQIALIIKCKKKRLAGKEVAFALKEYEY